MTKIPSKVQTRLIAGIKKYQPILREAQERKANESDTVFIIRDMLCEIFGYEKNTEITSELRICGQFCDLATVIDNDVQTLIEAKAINLLLKDSHITQAVDYAIKQPVDWVVLTNSVVWQVHKVWFANRVEHEKILEIDFLALDHHKQEDLENLFLLTKESWPKSGLHEYSERQKALSKYSLAAVILSDPILNAIRHELRQLMPEVKIDADQIQDKIEREVLELSILKDEKMAEAKKAVTKLASKERKSKIDKEFAEGNTTLIQKTSSLPSLSDPQPAGSVSATPAPNQPPA